MKTRHQEGYVYRKGKFWFLRYYDSVIGEDGLAERKQLAKRLAPFCDRYR